ncbi:hypothetical protein DL769_009629 [Monosporascus sp. CRB-8-3]|nr:hypothetical protein DL769_009629 [Monosporascus sp. CRB-8-3]
MPALSSINAVGLLAYVGASLAAYTGAYTVDNPYQIPAKPNGLDTEMPNMILFMPDQLRYDSVGIFGNEIIQTPNLDAFAREGTRFTNTFVQASVCSQSRTSMFTGQYPHVSGHRSIDNLLKPWEPNVFRALKEHGYHVAYLAPRGDLYADGATELGVNEYGFLSNQTLPAFIGGVDFDTSDVDSIWNRLFYVGSRNESEALDYDEFSTRGALKWLETPPEEPWVLFLPLLFPHCPFGVEEPFFSMYNRSQMPLPPSAEDRTGYTPQYMKRIRETYGTDRATSEMWQEVIAVYYGMISRVDWQFGRIMNKTKELGLWDKTVTIFFTDHGEFLGDFGLIEKWPSALTDSLTHEPMIIGGAGLPRDVIFDEMAEMVDLVPTLLHFGTANTTYAQYGKSLVDGIHALGRGEKLSHKKYSFTEGGFLTSEEPLLEQSPFPYDIKSALQHNHTESVGKAVAIRDKEWTYVYRLYEPDELYTRNGSDPHEAFNVAADPEFQDVRARLREVALKWMVESADVMPWYTDKRMPEDVDLASPWEQYMDRKAEL